MFLISDADWLMIVKRVLGGKELRPGREFVDKARVEMRLEIGSKFNHPE